MHQAHVPQGAVYLAEDSVIGQQVAIKVVRTDAADYPDPADVQQVLERFKHEVRVVASLDHLHILPLYRYGEEETESGQRAYMVMHSRSEGSLWDWLRQRATGVDNRARAVRRRGVEVHEERAHFGAGGVARIRRRAARQMPATTRIHLVELSLRSERRPAASTTVQRMAPDQELRVADDDPAERMVRGLLHRLRARGTRARLRAGGAAAETPPTVPGPPCAAFVGTKIQLCDERYGFFSRKNL